MSFHNGLLRLVLKQPHSTAQGGRPLLVHEVEEPLRKVNSTQDLDQVVTVNGPVPRPRELLRQGEGHGLEDGCQVLGLQEGKRGREKGEEVGEMITVGKTWEGDSEVEGEGEKRMFVRLT